VTRFASIEWRWLRSVRPAALGLAIVLGPVAPALESQDGAPPAAAGKKTDPLAEPWPDAERLKRRRESAQNLPLFRTAPPLDITLAAAFKEVNDDREVESTKRFPGVLTVAGTGGKPVAIPVQLGTRGHLRLNRRVCSFVPLKVEFSKAEAKGTAFESQGSLKMVTHCQNSGDHDQFLLGEALAYRIANLLTPLSFRVRVARATYVDSTNGKKLTTRWSMFIEDQDDVARRAEARLAPIEKRLFHHVDRSSLLRLAVFQVLIGNTDYSISALHNVRLLQDRDGVLRPVAYDFDVSGLVNPPYAAADPRLRIANVQQRLYRGPCVPLEHLEPTLAEFRAKGPEILALCDAEAGFTPRTRSVTKDYLKEFFDIIANPKRSKFLFVDKCRPLAGI
jgi:hypothetical protein